MIAFGTFKKKSAFKLYARSQNMDFDLANTISEQIGEYDEAMKFAEEDEELDIMQFVDEKYWDYITKSEKYLGITSDKKKAPSAYLLYDGDIRREIGLIKCKSESTGKEYITTVIDGAIAENYKFLKNDILKVDVVLLIEKVFNRIGIEHFDVNTLIEKVTGDQKVWDIYANGFTCGVNQVEKEGSKRKCMNYKPTNISELSAFVAAIRPGFKSMYKKFESREDFSWGIPALDSLVRTKELPVSFLFFQEQVMAVLNYAGFPMDQCYGIIKAIAKKHPEKVKPLKEQFLKGFKQKVMEDNVDEPTAIDYANRVWEIVNDNTRYSFNSSHAYCMALDSLYQAWQKAYYPYEFYEVLLQHYTDKGNKDKVQELKVEMKKAFGIKEGQYRFRNDNHQFKADPKNGVIYSSLSSIKGLSNTLAKKLYELRNNQYDSFIDLLPDLSFVDKDKLDTLIAIGYFEEFGEINQLFKYLEIYKSVGSRSQINKCDIEKFGIPEYLISKYAKETDKLYKITDRDSLIKELVSQATYKETSAEGIIHYEQEYLGHIMYTNPKLKKEYYFVEKIDGNMNTLYQIKTGDIMKIKCRAATRKNNPFEEGDILKIALIEDEKRWSKDSNGNWIRIDELEPILKKYSLVNKNKCCSVY